MIKISSIFVLFLCAAYVKSEEVNANQIFLIEIFRHGARGPLNNFLNETWVETVGFGELTSVGMREEYVSGQQMRSDYSNFLPKTYNSTQIYVRAGDYNRTIMSAQSLLMGLFYDTASAMPQLASINLTYPPDNITVDTDFEFESGLPNEFQPVPIHVTNLTYDLIIEATVSCPLIMEKINQTYSENEYEEYKKYFEETIDELDQIFHLKEYYHTESVTFQEASKTYDYVITQLYYGEETSVEYESPLWYELESIQNVFFFWEYNNPSYSEALSNGIVTFLIDEMEQKIDDVSSPLKLAMLSGHDSNLVNLLSTFGLSNPNCLFDLAKEKKLANAECQGQPPFASNMFWELYQDVTNSSQFYTKMKYNDIYYSSFCPAPIGDYCPWEYVKPFLLERTVDNIDNICHDYAYTLKNEGAAPYQIATIIIGILELLTILAGVLILVKLIKLKRLLKNNQQDLSDNLNDIHTAPQFKCFLSEMNLNAYN